MRMFKNLLKTLTRSCSKRTKGTEAHEQPSAVMLSTMNDTTSYRSRYRREQIISVTDVHRCQSRRQSEMTNSSRRSGSLALSENIEMASLTESSVETQSKFSLRPTTSSGITSSRHKFIRGSKSATSMAGETHSTMKRVGEGHHDSNTLSAQSTLNRYHSSPGILRPTLPPLSEEPEESCGIEKCDHEVPSALIRRSKTLVLSKVATRLADSDTPMARAAASPSVPQASQSTPSSPLTTSPRIYHVRCKTARGTRSPLHSPSALSVTSVRPPIRSPGHSTDRSGHRVAHRRNNVSYRSPTRDRRNPQELERKNGTFPSSPRSPRNICRGSRLKTVPQDQAHRVARSRMVASHQNSTAVYWQNDLVEQLRLDRIRRLKDVGKNRVHQSDENLSQQQTRVSSTHTPTKAGITTFSRVRRLDVRSPNMYAESPRLTTFRSWMQLRQQHLNQQDQGLDKVTDDTVAKPKARMIRVSSKGVTMEEIPPPTACRPLAGFKNMAVDGLGIHDIKDQKSEQAKCLRGRRCPSQSKKANQDRIPAQLRRELEATSRRIRQTEASVVLEWQEKFEDLSQAICRLGVVGDGLTRQRPTTTSV